LYQNCEQCKNARGKRFFEVTTNGTNVCDEIRVKFGTVKPDIFFNNKSHIVGYIPAMPFPVTKWEVLVEVEVTCKNRFKGVDVVIPFKNPTDVSPWPAGIGGPQFFFSYTPNVVDYAAVDWKNARVKVKEHPMANIALTWDFSVEEHKKLVNVLKLFMNYLSPSWRFQIKCASRVVPLYYRDNELRDAVNSGRMYLDILPWSSYRSYTLKQLDVGYWLGIQGDNILNFQSDCVICRNSSLTVDDFVGYDYIGGPWRNKELKGGNSGFSLRSRAAMVELLLTNNFPTLEHRKTIFEDVEISVAMAKYNDANGTNPYNISSQDDGKLFSSDQLYYPRSLGCHKPLKHMKRAQYDEFCQYCPELGILEPRSKKEFLAGRWGPSHNMCRKDVIDDT